METVIENQVSWWNNYSCKVRVRDHEYKYNKCFVLCKLDDEYEYKYPTLYSWLEVEIKNNQIR